MTGILSNQLPGRANPPDADNPLGSFKDRTAPGANDGSYLTQTWSNDRDSILQALFIASGLTPNGIEDTGTASQLFDALVNNRWSSIGNYLVGTVVTASDGNQYYCKSNNGRDSSVVDPTTVSDRNTWVRYPFEEGSNSNGDYRINFDDSIDQWGRFTTQSNGIQSVTFPIPFTGNISDIRIVMSDESGSDLPINISSFGYGTTSLTGFTGLAINVSSGSATSDTCSYYAHSRG